MHAVESTAWDDWGEEVEDPFEDAIVEAERIFDALVKEAKKRFYAYSAKLGLIEATHGHA